MAATPCGYNYGNSSLQKEKLICSPGLSVFTFQERKATHAAQCSCRGRIYARKFSTQDAFVFPQIGSFSSVSKKMISNSVPKKFSTITRSSGSSNSSGDQDETSEQKKTPFGYSRKDVILIGVGLTLAGYGLKGGLEYLGVDPLQSGNVVQLVLVLGLTIGWISTYIFRVSNKEMTYAQQLRDYEVKVMQKRLDSLTEAELEVLLEQVEEEKRRLAGGEQAN